jgi:TRAP-type C4-dicarboxylate transport system permease small subunit
MFYRYFKKLTEVIVILCSMVMTFIVFIQVVLRYVFKTGISFGEELPRYLMVWIVFVAAGLALQEDSHVKIVLLVDKFRGRTRLVLDLVAQVLILGFVVLLLIETIFILPYQKSQIILSMRIPIFWFYLGIPVGCSVMILFLLPKIREKVKKILTRAK